MKLYRTEQGWFAERGGQYVHLANFCMDAWLAGDDPVGEILQRTEGAWGQRAKLPRVMLPMGSQEVWAAGVTYLRSKTARMEESEASASLYDRVYDADRPEIFFKATPGRCVADGGVLLLRKDSKWMVPEPELTLVVSAKGKLVGFTLGDDLSSRDIEGENTLYLPQAKVWDRCCAIGPCILVNDGSVDIKAATIEVEIVRGGKSVFSGSTGISRIKRSFDELISWLFRHHSLGVGVLLLTGTGIVPPDEFTLQAGDTVRISMAEIGTLTTGME
jgi:2-dehydro-3-deoxy-D-arabinonate dehydratase